MKSSPAPQAPDPKTTAAAQTGTNVSTAVANAMLGNVNQVTPNGNLTYSQTGTYDWTDPTSGANYKLPTYTATTSLSPQQQAISDQNNAASLNLATTANKASAFLGDYLGKGADTSGIPGVQYDLGKGIGIKSSIDPTSGSIQHGFGDAGAITKSYGANDYSADRTKIEDAMFSRLNPQIEQSRAAEETRLQNQGIRIGSTAWENAMADFNKGVNDQRTSVVLAGGQEQSRLAGLERDKATFENAAQQQNYGQLFGRATFNNQAQDQEFGQNAQQAAFHNSAQQQWFGQAAARQQANNSARSQAISEAYAARNQPINEISALMSGSAVQSPQFQSTSMPQIPTVDYAGLVQSNYANRMAAWQQQQANSQSMLGGLFGLGSAAIMASDRRLKTAIERVGTGPLGLPLYSFAYIWGGPRRIGVMAQDVARVLPEAVVKWFGDFLAVDYAKLGLKEAV